MRIIEILLVALVLVLLVMNIPYPQNGWYWLPVSLGVLSCFYAYLGFALFNGIRFRRVFRADTYKTVSTAEIVIAILAGFSIGICVIGPIFIIQNWPGMINMRNSSLLFSILIVIAAALGVIVKRSALARRILIRAIPLSLFAVYIFVKYPLPVLANNKTGVIGNIVPVVPIPNETGKFVFLSVGFPNPRSPAQDSIEQKWGIEYDNLGCLVYDGLLDSVDKHNAKVKAALAVKYGNDWEERYNSELAE